MTTKQTWRVALATGEVREVEVAQVDGGWQAWADGPGIGGFSRKSARRAVVQCAQNAGWEISGVLAPGESSRAELLTAARAMREAQRDVGRAQWLGDVPCEEYGARVQYEEETRAALDVLLQAPRDADLHDALIAAMKARGATYSDDSFYGLCHETAHGLHLGCDRFDRESINAAIAPRPARERMRCEVIAHGATRRVCELVGVPLFADSVRYSARGTLAFAAERCEPDVDWGVEDFVAADRAGLTRDVAAVVARALLALAGEVSRVG